MDLQIVLDFLRQTLETSRGPTLAAVLKSRLNSALVAQGHEKLDERKLGFRKFSDLLQSQQAWLDITPPIGPGDLSVDIKAAPRPAALSDVGEPHLAIRSDIWQAFTNPDPQRERFFRRQAKTIFHFKRDGQEAIPNVLEQPDLIPIHPIPGTRHVAWMKEYLESSGLPPTERASVEAMLTEDYTSGLNLTFTRALGANALSWRSFRTRRITDFILEWARSHNLSESDLEKPLKPEAPSPTPVATTSLPPREQIGKLLDLLSDEDLNKVVLPILLSTILVKAKM